MRGPRLDQISFRESTNACVAEANIFQLCHLYTANGMHTTTCILDHDIAIAVHRFNRADRANESCCTGRRHPGLIRGTAHLAEYDLGDQGPSAVAQITSSPICSAGTAWSPSSWWPAIAAAGSNAIDRKRDMAVLVNILISRFLFNLTTLW